MIRLSIPLALLSLAGCAMQEEMVMIEEPIMEEEVAGVEPDQDCKIGDDDGIGGTGCEPVARRAPPWR